MDKLLIKLTILRLRKHNFDSANTVWPLKLFLLLGVNIGRKRNQHGRSAE